jgi:hypothetical protein
LIPPRVLNFTLISEFKFTLLQAPEVLQSGLFQQSGTDIFQQAVEMEAATVSASLEACSRIVISTRQQEISEGLSELSTPTSSNPGFPFLAPLSLWPMLHAHETLRLQINLGLQEHHQLQQIIETHTAALEAVDRNLAALRRFCKAS